MATYELNLIKELLESIQSQNNRIEEKLDTALAALNTAEIVDITNEIQAQKAAANEQPAPSDEPNKPETTGSSSETGSETTGETAGNTETVGATRVGA